MKSARTMTSKSGRHDMGAFSQRKVTGGLAVALAASALALASVPSSAFAQRRGGIESAAAALFSKRVTLGVGKTIIIDLPADAAEIVVGDPKVANAVVRSTRKLYVMGIGTGQTTILAMSQSGQQIANIEMNVGRDLEELDKLLRASLPKSRIVVKQVNDSVVLTGDARSAGEAATAMDIAKAFVTRSGGPAAAGADAAGTVVNAITIRGQDQVMVKLTVAEVQRNILKQLGVSTSPTGAETLFKSTWGIFSQQNPFTLNGSLSGGGLQVPLGNSLSATISAFERYGVSRILAEPTVTAISGESAKFTVGGELPVPQSSTCTPNVIGSATCTVGITYKNYGVTLNMTPVVVSEGRILLRLATEVTEVDPTQTVTISSVSVPGFRTRKNETSVELPSGGSLVTAGLITSNSRQAINGIPGLINLPILGSLFRSRDYQRNETELMIVVTPYIAKSVAPSEVQRPDDGFADASDPQAWLLGRVNRLYSSRSNPEAVRNWKGRFGFIQD